MGRGRRRPKRLAEKLLQIRKALGVSQREMAERLNVAITNGHISRYERNRTEPTIKVLLRYARIAGVQLAQIVDDEEGLTLKPNLASSVQRET